MWGYDCFSCLDWKLGGVFGLLTYVKRVICAYNVKMGVF
jgi:hypothetical protein